jgi:hypothetical protein
LDKCTSALPPPTYRGAEITPGIDWLQFSTGLDREDIFDALRAWVPGDFVEAEQGLMGYEYQAIGPGGARVLWSLKRPEVHVVLPGMWCRAASQEALSACLQFVCSIGSVTRIDIRLDVTGLGEAFPTQVRAAFERGESVSHAAKWRWTESADGRTFNLGSGSSRRQLRVYELYERGDVVRWELQERDEAAASCLAQLAIEPTWGAAIAARLVSFVDFRDGAGQNVTRRVRVGWFAALVAGAEKAAVYAATPLRTFAQVDAFVRKHWSPMLAAWFTGLGGDLNALTAVLEAGMGRWGVRHKLVAMAT